MKRGSLKLRLLAAGVASILLALAVAGFGLRLLFERHVERRIAAELQADLGQLVAGLDRGPDGSFDVVRPPAEPRFAEPLSGLYWQIAAEPGGGILRSRSLWDVTLDLPPDPLAGAEVHQHTIQGPGGSLLFVVERSITLPPDLGGGNLRVAVAIDRAEINAAGRAFATDLIPSLALLAGFLAAASWAQVAVGLKPLDAVRQRLHAVRAGQEARLGSAFPDEVRPLAAEVDHLLEAQGLAIERARARAADLAHGLKTPLTILASDAEELRGRGETGMADEIAGLTDGMRRHVERELARVRAGTRPRRGPFQPVRPVVDQVVTVLRRTPRGQTLHWNLDLAEDLTAPLDRQDLAEILGNLGENAVKWAASRVRISAREEDEAITLHVEDDGPGIPDGQIGTALARGGRLDEAQPGSGLGLAIVADLAEAYGGSLTVGRSPLGGLLAEFRLPLKPGEDSRFMRASAL